MLAASRSAPSRPCRTGNPKPPDDDPLLMLALLTVSLLIVWRLRSLGLQLSLAPGGVIGLVLVLLLTARAHFFSPEALAAMLPPFVPARLPLVYVTGVLELALALGLALPPTRRLA